MKQHIALLGDGAWGTAIATLLAHNGHTVKLWCYNADLVDSINRTHVNQKYLPGITLWPSIIACATIQEAVRDAQWVFQAIPVKYIRTVLSQAKSSFNAQQQWVTLSKGIEQDTLMVPTQIITDILGKHIRVAAVSGPSFAYDVARQQLTAFVVASDTVAFGQQVSDLLACDYVKTYLSTDAMGVQLCGALKNVITIAINMLEGAGYSDTTRAFILTKGLHEMQELAAAMAGQKETVYGFAGVGDLVLTAYSKQSKNARVGIMLGKGQSFDTILAQAGSMPEGINTVQSVVNLADRYNLALPICRALQAVILGKKTVAQFLQDIIKSLDTITT